MSATDPEISAAIDIFRAEMHNYIDRSFDKLKDKLITEPSVTAPKLPTNEACQDPANKIGSNLTERGAEILYRLFDHGAGYNRASKALGITQTAARNRKGLWEKLGGMNRKRVHLPGID
ncbi:MULTISPECIES: hypothetical protein [Xanthobacter]|uniref:DNA binding HTH domain-containing protein n=1 Tax=Xanthobacter aminoxidans TaxID=186280 RepID=A0ABW6ZH95_9HYPH|nr:hypothetical protein [Xanthobacter sp. 91]